MSNAMNMNTSNLPLHEGLPLQGIQVVDFGCYLAGPLVGRHLADAGATVISIQPPSGPLYKNIPVNHMLNRGKKIIQIDLKTKEGQRHAWELVLQADVLIENFSNGTMAKFGLSSDAVKRSNPKIIYLSLPGFASCDEEFAEMKHYEAIIMAQCGVYCDMGLNRTLMGINPSYSPLPLASTYGSIVGALGIVLGLIGREGKNGNDSGDGDGDIMEVPLGAALCDALVFNSMDIPSLPPRYLTIRELEIATNRKLGKKMDYNYRQVKELLDPFYHTYICKDRRPFYIVAPCHAGHQTRALKALGIWEDMVALGLPTEEGDVYAESNTWNKNSGSGSGSGNGMNMVLGTYPLTDPVWIVRFKEAMKKAFLKKTAKEWEVIFMGYKVTGAATMTSKEWLHSEHANASGLVIERYNPMLKCMQKEAGPVVWQKRSICPTSKVMREQCQAKAMSNFVNLKKKDLWLTGTKVVDLANVIAGPTIGGMLARYGADVLKCDPTKPTYDALVAVYMGCPINTGKKSLLVNIKKSKNGKDILKRLIEWADVCIVNQTTAQLRSLGVDELSLKRINPNIILAHFDAFGGPHHGPRSDAVGYDDLVQAATGIMVRFGGSLKTPAEHAHLGTVDVVSGFSGCLSTCLSLFKRLRTGVCDVARTSLASNAQFIQIPFMSDWVGKNPSIVANEPSGPYAVGEHWLYRWYKTKYIGLKNNVEESMGIEAAGGNGHIFIALGSLNGSIFQNAIAVLSRLGCKDMYKEGMTDNDRSNKLQKWILNLRLNADEVSYLLNKNGITNIPLNSMTNLRESNTSTCKSFSLNQNNSGGLTHHFHKIKNHPIGGSVEMYSPCSLLSSNVEINIMKPQPKYGEHTKLILKNVLHFNDNEINTFIKNGDVGLQWSNHYIPDGGTNLNPWNNVKMEYKVMMDRVKQLRIVDSKL